MRIGVHGLCESAFTENAKHRSRCMRIFTDKVAQGIFLFARLVSMKSTFANEHSVYVCEHIHILLVGQEKIHCFSCNVFRILGI